MYIISNFRLRSYLILEIPYGFKDGDSLPIITRGIY
jgi:hypothetical protein